MGRLDVLVAEPERDRGRVNPSVQELHRSGVSEHVRFEAAAGGTKPVG
ncbi:MAG TPA: hypothetical protein VNU24_00325 [Solirubrobacteraceae bacterium]|jgi:hypothetical protein|nr:hypothetical protein [Solirubrobacteraceae bacterium]